jgi:DNA-binding LacI/PurR family transcriptional regulator
MPTSTTTRTRHAAKRTPEPLVDRLRRLACDHGPNAKLPTARDLCKELDTNQAALNIALRDLEANSLIYRKHAVGIFVSPKIHTKSIVVLYDTFISGQPGLSPFWGMLWGALIEEAQARSETANLEFTFRMTMSGHDPDLRLPPDVMRSLGDGLVHGIVGIGLTIPNAEAAAAYGVPVVSFAGAGQWQVASDIGREVRAGVDTLIDRGCRSVELWRGVLLGDPFIPSLLNDEVEAFKDQLTVRNLPFRPDAVRNFWDSPGGQFRGTLQQHGYRMAMEAFGPDATRPPDGVLILDDMITSGALFALRNLGPSLEKTAMIATIANAGSTVLFGHERSLILIVRDPRIIAISLLDALDLLLDGRAPDANPTLLPLEMRFPEEYPGVLFGM